MGYLKTNLEKLKNKDEYIYEKLNEYIYQKRDIKEVYGKFKLVTGRDQSQTVEVCAGEKDVRLNSVYNSSREAEKWADKYKNISKITSFIMFGMGNGVFFNAIKKQLNVSAYILFFEPDIELFLFCLESFDMRAILSDNRVALYINGINDKEFYKELSGKINWAMLSTQLVCCHPSYDRLYREEYIKYQFILEQLEKALTANKKTSLKFAKKFTINAIQNLKHIKNSNYISEFIGKIKEDVPVIIAAAGPSLDKNVDILKKAEKKAFILATDTSVKYLLAHGIRFDAIVTVDGRKRVEHLKSEECLDYPMFTIPDARSEILDENHARKIWITGSGYLETLYDRFGYHFPEYNSGGSVATAAFWLAKTLRLKTIILIGQDLAYDGDMTHAGGIKRKVLSVNKNTPVYIEAVDGKKVQTRADWLNYLRWFENEILQLNGETEVIDATEGGAKIAGTKIMSLSDAIDCYCKCEFNFNSILENTPVTFDKEKYTKVCEETAHLKEEFQTIAKAGGEGEAMADRIMLMLKEKQINLNKIEKEQREIRKLQGIIKEQKVYTLLDEYISADIADRIEAAAKNYDSELEQITENMISVKILFVALQKAVDELMPVLEQTLEQM